MTDRRCHNLALDRQLSALGYFPRGERVQA